MSTTAELETFVRKFHQLWNDGQSAHLDLDCQAGVAWVGLRLQLGRPPGPTIMCILLIVIGNLSRPRMNANVNGRLLHVKLGNMLKKHQTLQKL